jgi:hypothetical protein
MKIFHLENKALNQTIFLVASTIPLYYASMFEKAMIVGCIFISKV